jgi:hypothetical protein
MTPAVDSWPAYARLVAVASAATYPQLLHHHPGRDPSTVVKTLSRVGWAPGRRVGREPREGREGIPGVVTSASSYRSPTAALGTPSGHDCILLGRCGNRRPRSQSRTTPCGSHDRSSTKHAGSRPRRWGFQPLPELRPASDRLAPSNRNPDRSALTDIDDELPPPGHPLYNRLRRLSSPARPRATCSRVFTSAVDARLATMTVNGRLMGHRDADSSPDFPQVLSAPGPGTSASQPRHTAGKLRLLWIVRAIAREVGGRVADRRGASARGGFLIHTAHHAE